MSRVPKLSGARYYDEVLGHHACVQVEQLCVGKAHAVAVQRPTPEDPLDFYAWGANALAQQGNGLRADATQPKVASWSPPGRLPLLAPKVQTKTWWGGTEASTDTAGESAQVEGLVVCDGDNSALFAPPRR